MSEKSNSESVQAIYAAFGRGDIASVLERLTDDIDWEFLGPKDIPYSGNRRGRDQVTRFFSDLAGTSDPVDFKVDQLVSAGDTVIALGHETFHVKATGREWQAQWAHVYTFRDGKIARFREYSDSAAIRDAYHP